MSLPTLSRSVVLSFHVFMYSVRMPLRYIYARAYVLFSLVLLFHECVPWRAWRLDAVCPTGIFSALDSAAAISSSSWLHLLMHPSGRSYAVFFLNLTLSFSIFFHHNSGLAWAASSMCRGLGCHGSIGGFFISRWARHNPHFICYVHVFLCTDSTSVFISCICHVFLFIPF